MDKVSVLDIIDRDSEQNAQVIIRSVKGFVALTLTLEHEGDVQVVFSPAECAEVIARLQEAISDARSAALVSGPRAATAPMPNPAAPKVSRLDYNGKIKNG